MFTRHDTMSEDAIPYLLRCPFCGGPGEIEDLSTDFGVEGGVIEPWFLAGCKGCDIWFTTNSPSANQQMAADLWNRRAP